ncbi:MAG: 30S ribosomal protein S27e [Thermofilaceae archaeon]
MPKFSKILKPVPRSRFILVRCPDCGNEQVLFSHSSTLVSCRVCGRGLAKPTGGKAIIEAQTVRVLDKF